MNGGRVFRVERLGDREIYSEWCRVCYLPMAQEIARRELRSQGGAWRVVEEGANVISWAGRSEA